MPAYEENNPIGNEGVLQLKKLNGVATKLNIKGTNITDRILEGIFALKFSELKLSRHDEMQVRMKSWAWTRSTPSTRRSTRGTSSTNDPPDIYHL